MYVISYDIASDRLRGKVAKKLLDYGKRVQFSVFECDIEKERYKKLYRELVKLLDGAENAGVRIYFIDKAAQEKTVVIGEIKCVSLEEQWNSIVIV